MIDAGEEDDGTPFIVLEYVEGETLKDRIRRMGRLPVTEAVAYAIEIARGLQAAHERDIVHRDVKPQNVLLDEHGVARVTDFGIARSLRDEGLTADGRVLGTTDYVSPEQALGHQVTPQSDIYSLGVVLYEMLTGDVPFHGETQVSVAMHHVRDELPDVQAGRPEISSALAAIVDTATAKDLAERYAGTGGLISDLEDALAIESRPQRPDHRRGDDGLPVAARHQAPARARTASSHPARWIAGIAVLTLAIAIAALLLANRAERGTGTSGARAAAGLHRRDPRPEQRRGLRPGRRRRRARQPRRRRRSTAIRAAPGTPRPTSPATSPRPASGSPSTPSRASTRARSAIDTPTPGWSGSVYAAAGGNAPPAKIDDPAWKKVGSIPLAERAHARRTSTRRATPFRWYLVWIEKFAPGQEKVEISEIYLYR